MVQRVRADLNGNNNGNGTRKRGRPKGSVGIPKNDGRSLTARQIRAWAFRSGELPHVILLKIARGEKAPLGRAPTCEEIIDCAKACAPYFVPKLSSVAVTGEDGGPVQTQNFVLTADVLGRLSDGELEVFRYLFGKLTGSNSGGDGSGRAITSRTPEEKVTKPYTRTIDSES